MYIYIYSSYQNDADTVQITTETGLKWIATRCTLTACYNMLQPHRDSLRFGHGGFLKWGYP